MMLNSTPSVVRGFGWMTASPPREARVLCLPLEGKVDCESLIRKTDEV